MKNFVVLIHKTVHVVESSLSCLCAIRWVSVDIESDETIAAGERRLFRRLSFRLVIHKQFYSPRCLSNRVGLRDKGERSHGFTFER